ncbi:hypothetical protein E3N88_34275 [Mikania micrantha]|uniref:Transcription factor CBF/NF-Y/archaeal histone domain-containing protein n=1 Tax=Mikania micrantha TaxID=192012 RepID=A0A5N6LXN0_9ASTR|nr:hypothetical protein E3N88_34275 [Mikania micrantha]
MTNSFFIEISTISSKKSECRNGSFNEKMKEELYAVSNELRSTGVDELNSNVKNNESNLLLTISIIMSSFVKDAKETVQECVSEFISFVNSEYIYA